MVWYGFSWKTSGCLLDICHQILDLYSHGKKPISQQIQEKERVPAPPAPAPPVPQGQPPATNPPPPPPKKTPPQGSSPARQLKRLHVSGYLDVRSLESPLVFLKKKVYLKARIIYVHFSVYFRHPQKMNQRLQVRLLLNFKQANVCEV